LSPCAYAHARKRYDLGRNNQSAPRFDVLVALSDGLGVGLSALIPDDEEGQAS
jgi:hypothetical protein